MKKRWMSWLIRLRYTLFSRRGIRRLFYTKSAKVPKIRKNDQIVIVGIGIGGLTAARLLKKRGFNSVTVVSKDLLFGGKCVNFGCMPTEYIFSQSAGADLQSQVSNFVSGLRGTSESQFQALGYKHIQNEVAEIKGQELIFKDGKKLSFDRLILATGSRMQGRPGLRPNLSLESLWSSAPGQLLIVSNGNPASLSVASVAARLGYKTTLALESTPVISHLPSFQYFSREIAKKVRIVKSKVIQGEGLNVEYLNGRDPAQSYDYIMYYGSPTDISFPVDGKPLLTSELDLLTGSVPRRPEISLIGDAGGFLSAAEAEIHARKVINHWLWGGGMDLSACLSMPVRLHSECSLGMIGNPIDVATGNWREIDFRSLGWAAISGKNGKLWYKLSATKKQLTSLHVCHPDAGELIGQASALMSLPIDDPRWMTGAVHPSAGEIFRVLAEQVLDELEYPALGDESRDLMLVLPSISSARLNQLDWISKDEWDDGVMSANPRAYFSALFGIRSLLQTEALSPRQAVLTKTRDPLGFAISGVKNVEIFEHSNQSGVTVLLKDRKAVVKYGSNLEEFR